MKRIIVVCVFLAVACTKNEAEQTADWNKNVTTAQQYAAKYPAFKSVLEKRTAEAQTSFDAAKAVADKDARSEAMGTANKMLTELLQDFASYESASKALNESFVKHASLPESLQPVINSAKEAQKSAARTMGGPMEPTNVGVAKKLIEDSIGELKEATDAVASTDGYLETEKELSALMADKDLLQLPAAKVNPALDAAKTAQRNAGYALTAAGGAPPPMAKAAVLKAGKILSEAIAPLKALKPAPAAPAKAVAKK